MLPRVMVPQYSQGSLWLQYCSRPAVCAPSVHTSETSAVLCVPQRVDTHSCGQYALSSPDEFFFELVCYTTLGLSFVNCEYAAERGAEVRRTTV